MGSRSQSRGSAETWPCPRVLSLDKKLRFTSSLSLSLIWKNLDRAPDFLFRRDVKEPWSLARVRVFRRVNYLSPKFRRLLITDYLQCTGDMLLMVTLH